ncbi:MAG: hypothetical protein ACP5JU_02780 [Minisyncoccia bacterium]
MQVKFKKIPKHTIINLNYTTNEIQDNNKAIEKNQTNKYEIEIYDIELIPKEACLIHPIKNTFLNDDIQIIKDKNNYLMDMHLKKIYDYNDIKYLNTSIKELKNSVLPLTIFFIPDILLKQIKLEFFNSNLNTNIINISTKKTIVNNSNYKLNADIILTSLKSENINEDLDTSMAEIDLLSGIEIFSKSENQKQELFFEELIKSDKKFPRGFSESNNKPIILLIEENEYEWHLPIIYSIKELFREITNKFPDITFRESELYEEGFTEMLDSTDLNSLEQFNLKHKIEFLDARKFKFTLDEFLKIIKQRLKSGFLQDFGVLIIAVKRDENHNENLKNLLNDIAKGLSIYILMPDDNYYEKFCSKLVGYKILNLENKKEMFFEILRHYEKYLNRAIEIYAPFIKRDENDHFQYPLKVIVFSYLVNKIIDEKKKLINSKKERYEFITEEIIKNGIIKVEEEIISQSGKKVIPDITYENNGKKIYIEIETLIGTIEPLKKIDETIEKYKDTDAQEIWVILKPISAMIYCEELEERKKIYEILYKDKNMKINFKTINIYEKGENKKLDLININDFCENNKDIVKKLINSKEVNDNGIKH